jgi:cytochrome c oxidase assembly protein subunit 11
MSLELKSTAQIQSSNRRMAVKLLFVVIGMFGFGFALVPLYDVFCEVTGLNGKTAGAYTSAEQIEINKDRIVTVQFMANNNDGMTWEFRPTQRSVKVHPGELNSVTFYASNPTDKVMVAQAVPSVSPFYVANYLHKTECFCFEQQQLEANQEVEMPLRFIIDSELPSDVNTLTLSYTLFDVTELASTN